MYSKAQTFGDLETAEKILKESNPVTQKMLGKNVKNFDERLWKERNLAIMKKGLTAKFTQNQYLKDFLGKTGTNTLLEANKHDRYWGIGMGLYDQKIWIRNSWVGKGENHLGRLLMDIRRELK